MLTTQLVTILQALAVPPSVAPLLVPDMAQRDMQVIVEVMDLDTNQARVLGDVLENYLKRLDRERLAAQESIGQASGESDRMSVDQDTRSELQAQWARRRQILAATEDFDARLDLEAQHRAWGREAVGQLLAESRQAIRQPSPRARAVESWTDTKNAMRAELDRDVRVLLGPEDMDNWRRVDGALLRQRGVFGSALPGETLDLNRVLNDALGVQPEVLGTLSGLRREYAVDWARAARKRNDTLAEIAAERIDAEFRGDALALLLLDRLEFEARARLGAVNERWYRQLGEALGDQDRITLQIAVNQAMYPEIFTPGRGDRVARWMLEQSDLDPETRLAVHQARASLGARRLRLAAHEREAVELGALRRVLLASEHAAMSHVLGPTAQFGFEDDLADSMLERAFELAARRRAIDATLLGRLRSIAPEFHERVPDSIMQPPAALVRPLQEDDQKPLRFLIVSE